MIRFPCPCQHPFELPDDMAGGLIQCPACGRLNDVPNLEDLKNLTPDGLYRVEDAAKAEAPRLENLRRVYSRRRVDERGEEIDLRPTADDVLKAGEQPQFELADAARPAAPKYDPVTGELIRPLDLQPIYAPHPSEIPIAKAALSYARPDLKDWGTRRPLLAMFLPANLFVIFAIVMMHAIIAVTMLAGLALRYLIILPLPLVLMLAIIAHYANIIEDIGPDGRDDLPAPMRNLNFIDDIWRPFCNMMLSVGLCYGPAIVLSILAPARPPADAAYLGLLGAGTMFFPAVLLAAATSGTLLNLWPPRVIGVIGVIGARYVGLVLLFVATVAFFGAAIPWNPIYYAFWNLAFRLFGSVQLSVQLGIFYGLLAVGIFLMHYFCWLLGLEYRAHHEQFPWLLQRHIRLPRTSAPGRPDSRPAPPA